MEFTAASYAWEPGDEDRITQVRLTDTSLSADWVEGDKTGHLEADSEDGVTYEGNFGYPVPNYFRRVKFKRFDSRDGEVILLGRWRNASSGKSGSWMIRLTPAPGQ